MTGVGSAEVTALQNLIVNITSTGSVVCHGSPHVREQQTSIATAKKTKSLTFSGQHGAGSAARNKRRFEVGPRSGPSLSSIDTLNTTGVIFNDFGSISTFF